MGMACGPASTHGGKTKLGVMLYSNVISPAFLTTRRTITATKDDGQATSLGPRTRLDGDNEQLISIRENTMKAGMSENSRHGGRITGAPNGPDCGREEWFRGRGSGVGGLGREWFAIGHMPDKVGVEGGEMGVKYDEMSTKCVSQLNRVGALGAKEMVVFSLDRVSRPACRIS